ESALAGAAWAAQQKAGAILRHAGGVQRHHVSLRQHEVRQGLEVEPAQPGVIASGLKRNPDGGEPGPRVGGRMIVGVRNDSDEMPLHAEFGRARQIAVGLDHYAELQRFAVELPMVSAPTFLGRFDYVARVSGNIQGEASGK